jgi:hypothetical protein
MMIRSRPQLLFFGFRIQTAGWSAIRRLTLNGLWELSGGKERGPPGTTACRGGNKRIGGPAGTAMLPQKACEKQASRNSPSFAELFPEIVEPDPDSDDLPSGSAAEALDRQEPFVNPTLANHGLALLARLFRYGRVSYHGGFVNLSGIGAVQALRVDPKDWARLRRKPKVLKRMHGEDGVPRSKTD